MKRKILSLVLLCMGLLFVSNANAQTGSLQGVVTDATSGDALPGANIYIVGLQRGASTNIEGEYSILEIPNGTYTARVTFIGYKRTERQVNINGETTLDVALEEDFIGLDEVVVTGQGSAIEKKRLSTTVETISAKQLEQVPTQQLSQLLQGKLPNTQIRTSSGQPGTSSIIRSRGITSANSSSTPVIYVDGVRVDNLNSNANLAFGTGGADGSSIPDIPIENIERIEFVKGGAAATLYGADAASGVIQIFTKKGVQGRSRFTFETRQGVSAGTEDYLWSDNTAEVLFDPGHIQEYRISGDGGVADLTYSFSASMSEDNGFRPNNEQIQYNLRTTLNAKVNPITQYTGSLGFVSNQFGRDYNANSSFGAFGGLESGGFGPFSGDFRDFSGTELQDLKDYVKLEQPTVGISEEVKRFQTSHSLNFDPIENLTAKVTAGIDYRVSTQSIIQTNEFLVIIGSSPPGTTDQGSVNRFNREFLGLTFEGNAQYSATVGDFSFVSTAGAQMFRNEDIQNQIVGNSVTDGSKSINNGASQTATDFLLNVVNWGVFGQENIGYKDKLFLELGIRGDRNTAFGDEIGTEWFPKIGGAYNISSEPFFKNAISSNIISNLKLRANYGEAGKFPTPFANNRVLNVNPYLGIPSFTFGQPGDPSLTTEVTKTTEFGGDIAFYNDRISFEVTYYKAITEDALFNAPFASSFGLGNQLRNVGKIENKGFEISGNFVIVNQRDLSVRVNASLNTLDNEVTDNGGTSEFASGGFQFLGSFVKEGQPVGYLRGSRPTFNAAGELADVEQNAVLGDPSPDLFGSFGLNMSYKNFDLSAFADYQKGAQGVNVDEVLRFFGGLSDDRIPEASMGESFTDLAGVWVEDTDYIKVRLISVNYNIPIKYYEGIVSRITVGASVTNPFNFVKSDFDPEVTGAGIGNQNGVAVGGFGFGTESAPRQYMGSLKINF